MLKRVVNFFKNVKYLSKFDLRKECIDLRRENIDRYLVDCIDNVMYLIPNSGVVRPNILNTEQTLDMLCNSNKSLAHFGEGEIMVAFGKDIPFQDYDPILADRTKNILKNTNENLLVGISKGFFHPIWNRNVNKAGKDWILHYIPTIREWILSLIDRFTLYCSVESCWGGDKKNENFDKLRSIWVNKEILLIGCKEAADNIKYDLFDNAQKSSWFYIPNKNAFSIYDEILKECLSYSKDTLIIIMAGPTAGVLADDLSKLGYRALDLGHAAKAYDWYRSEKEISPDFWFPDE